MTKIFQSSDEPGWDVYLTRPGGSLDCDEDENYLAHCDTLAEAALKMLEGLAKQSREDLEGAMARLKRKEKAAEKAQFQLFVARSRAHEITVMVAGAQKEASELLARRERRRAKRRKKGRNNESQI